MLNSIQLKELYDSPFYPNVSSQTRTDIIGALGIELQGITVSEGGKFSLEELNQGLRYILLANKEYHSYIKRSSDQSSCRSTYDDPFVFTGSDLALWAIVLNDSNHHSNGNCFNGSNCSGEGGEGAFVICTAIVVLACAFGFCYCTGKNIKHTVAGVESKPIKFFKIASAAAVFTAAALLAWYLLPGDYTSDAFKKESPKNAQISSVLLHGVLSVFIGTFAAVIISYLNKKVICAPKKSLTPTKELLDELENVIKLLKSDYVKPGDDREQCIAFTKEVIRCYLNSISNDLTTKENPSNFPINTTVSSVVIPVDPSEPVSANSSSFFTKFKGSVSSDNFNAEKQTLLLKKQANAYFHRGNPNQLEIGDVFTQSNSMPLAKTPV